MMVVVGGVLYKKYAIVHVRLFFCKNIKVIIPQITQPRREKLLKFRTFISGKKKHKIRKFQQKKKQNVSLKTF